MYAKRTYFLLAIEVNVEKPIDQVPAEEVVEEIVDGNPTETQQQNNEPQEQVSGIMGMI